MIVSFALIGPREHFCLRVSQQWKSILIQITFFYRHEAKTHPGLWLSNISQTSEKVKVGGYNFFLCSIIVETG